MAIVQEHQPQSSSSSQVKKKKSKQQQASAAVDPAVTLIVAADVEHRDSDASMESGNSYVALASKRLRTLRKRLAKIEKYEEDLTLKGSEHQLNDDQLLAVQKKQEVVLLIKELEELIKQMEDRDAEDQRNLKKLRKQEQQERQRALHTARQEVKQSLADGLRQLTELMFVCNVVFPQMPATLISMPDRQHLIDFVNRISGFHVAIPPSSDRSVFDEQVLQAVSLLSSYLEQQLPNYPDIQSVIANSLALFTSAPEPVVQAPAASHSLLPSAGTLTDQILLDIPSLIGGNLGATIPGSGVQLAAGQAQLKFTTTPLIEDPAIVDIKESFEQQQIHEISQQQVQQQQHRQRHHENSQQLQDRAPRQPRQHHDKEKGPDGRPFRGGRRGRGRGGLRGGARTANGQHQQQSQE